MNDQAIHRLYRHFQELPVSMRTLFTGALLVLGLGYLFATLYILKVFVIFASPNQLCTA